jgi:hypothetical protein
MKLGHEKQEIVGENNCWVTPLKSVARKREKLY